MRKNTVDTFRAWQARRPYKGGGSAVWTDGQSIYSYSTLILERKGDEVWFNQKRYSVTTTNHQNGLRNLMIGEGMSWECSNWYSDT